MKKLIMVISLCATVAFAGDIRVVSPSVAPSTPIVDFSKATKINFVDSKPAQFTINVPLDIDPVEPGIPLKDDATNKTTGEQVLVCYLYTDLDITNGIYQRITLEKTGEYTQTVKFNNIPNYMAVKYNSYQCYVSYSGRDSALPGLWDIDFDTILYLVGGNIQ